MLRREARTPEVIGPYGRRSQENRREATERAAREARYLAEEGRGVADATDHRRADIRDSNRPRAESVAAIDEAMDAAAGAGEPSIGARRSNLAAERARNQAAAMAEANQRAQAEERLQAKRDKDKARAEKQREEMGREARRALAPYDFAAGGLEKKKNKRRNGKGLARR